MFEFFTDEARRTLILAQEHARSLNSTLGTEHVLVALLEDAGSIAAKALDASAITSESVRKAVESGGRTPSTEIVAHPATAAIKQTLEQTMKDALRLGHHHIGAEHLLLAAIGQRDGGAAHVLTRLGADLPALRAATLELIREAGPPPAPAARRRAPTTAHRPRRVHSVRQSTRFFDVAGQSDAVVEFIEVAGLLVGAGTAHTRQLPALLVFGPSGCGKTTLARALAGEAGAAFFSLHCRDLVQASAALAKSTVNDVFTEALQMAPAVVLIHDLDLLAPTADRPSDSAALEAILEAFGTPLVVIIGETARPDRVHRRLLDPGGFERPIGVDFPDEQGRLAILARHADDKVLDADVDLGELAKESRQLNGADLAHLIESAALLAERAGSRAIAQMHFEEAQRRYSRQL